MGVTSLITPIDFSLQIYYFDVWVMLAASILLGLLAYRKITISRTIGIIMTLAYAAYLITTIAISP